MKTNAWTMEGRQTYLVQKHVYDNRCHGTILVLKHNSNFDQ